MKLEYNKMLSAYQELVVFFFQFAIKCICFIHLKYNLMDFDNFI